MKRAALILATGMLILACHSKDPEHGPPAGRAEASRGAALFEQHCSSCHAPFRDCGYSLKGVTGRWSSVPALKRFIRDSEALTSNGDAYAKDLYQKWRVADVHKFPALSDAALDSLIAYIDK